MGVPKFYRWLSERYPKINQVVTDAALLPEFDHLYLDMNGIIHGCTHPSHLDVSHVLTEREMMLGIMHYLDRIITQIVKPKVSVFMAIDGVAPRAKLNQQRSRRFRSAKELAEASKGVDRSSVHVFDSNCITPGTEFMAKVSDTIKYFIRKKLKEDPVWRNLNVIFSGHEVPGEGEHKIMQHIREMKAQPGYQPNTRHVMYGQDADLIMLGLVTHEPHFTLLREIVQFGMPQTSENTLKTVKRFTKQSDFQLLHLSVLREYLELEFCRDAVFNIDLERVVDDFNFLTFLVGNDFLPHLQCLDIADGAFDLIFDSYKQERVKWGEGNYLTFLGEISSATRLEGLLALIGATETAILEQKEEDDAIYLKKRRKWDKRDGKAPGPSDAEIQAVENANQADFMTMIEEVTSTHSKEDFVDGWKPVPVGQKDFKGRYYFEKLKLTPVDKKEHYALRQSYIEGLMWCLAYYYKGCISWGWFYPYHYGPMLSDLSNLEDMFANIKFDLGEPLMPFQQLMGCLPPASSQLVPPKYRQLMTSPQSPIIQFYPTDFVVDMNGKRNPWEGVNLLPFIDVRLLKHTIATQVPDSTLTSEEKKRNSRGSVFLYEHDPTANETIPSPNRSIGLIDIQRCHSKMTEIDEPDRLDICFKPELVPGTKLPYPGFPSMNVLPIERYELTKIGLNCFGSASKYPNMILTLHQLPQMPPIEQLAGNVLGQSLFINWPMMHEARVVAVSDAVSEARLVKGKVIVKRFNEKQQDDWYDESSSMLQKYLTGYGVPGSGGLQINEILYRLKLLPLQGMKTNAKDGSTKKIFGKEEADVPLQVCLWNAPAPDLRFIEHGPTTIADRFPADSRVILTKGKHRGSTGTVVGTTGAKQVGVKVAIANPEEPFGKAIAKVVLESYVSSMDASKLLKLNPAVFGKVTGSLSFDPGRYDLGLNLKYSEGLCLIGYTRKRPEGKKGKSQNSQAKKAWSAGDSLLVVGSKRNNGDDKNEAKIQWEFTPKAIRLVSLYRQTFPQLFQVLIRNPNEKKYNASMLGPTGGDMLRQIRDWLNNVETAKLPRSPISTEALPAEAIQYVQRAADVRSATLSKDLKESLIKIPPSALYREGQTKPTDVLTAADFNDKAAPELGDRIVNLCANGLPFGARGTVVGVHDEASGCVEVVLDEEFVGGSSLQGACAPFRGKLVLWAHLLKITPPDWQARVEKLVPKGMGKVAAERIIADVERKARSQIPKKKQQQQEQQQQQQQPELAWGCAGVKQSQQSPPPPTNTAEQQQRPKQENSASKQPATQQSSLKPTAAVFTPPRLRNQQGSAGRGRVASAGRHGSAGRDRQAGWREAKGPSERGVGFKERKQTGISGLSRWKQIVSGKKPLQQTPKKILKPQPKTENALREHERNKTAGLKALLGVAQPPASESFQQQAPQAPDASSLPIPAPPMELPPKAPEATSLPVPATNDAASDALKGMLGVSGISTEPAVSVPAENAGASATLKGMLGVATPAPTEPQPPPQPQAPLSQQSPSAADKLMAMMQQKRSSAVAQQPYPPPQRSSFNFTYVAEGEQAPPAPPAPIAVPPPQLGFGGPMIAMAMPPPQIVMGMQPPPPPPQPSFSPPAQDFPSLGNNATESSREETIDNSDPVSSEEAGPTNIVPSSVT